MAAWLVTICALTALPSIAQEVMDRKAYPDISTGGNAEIRLKPQKLRAIFRVQYESRSPETAYDELEEHLKGIQQELLEMGGIKESFTATERVISLQIPGIQDVESALRMWKQRNQQYRQMAFQVPGVPGGQVQTPETPELDLDDIPRLSYATCFVACDWNIDINDPRSIAILAARLEQAYLTKKWSDGGFHVELSSEEQTVIDSLASGSFIHHQSNVEKPFRILYVAERTPEIERQGIEAAKTLAIKRARDAIAPGKTLVQVITEQRSYTNPGLTSNVEGILLPFNDSRSSVSNSRSLQQRQPNEVTGDTMDSLVAKFHIVVYGYTN
jgi:hypothetical protein